MLMLANRYDFLYNRLAIKHNATNWGSCSSKGNINLNLNIVRLPRVLQDYILLHELCHLRHHDHGQAFHLLLEHVLTDNMMRLMEEIPGNMSPADTALVSDLARKAASPEGLAERIGKEAGHVAQTVDEGYGGSTDFFHFSRP